MTPHTLEEQISLLAAEAEGKVIFVLYDNGARSHTKTLGYWRFDCCRYEVERPLMEEWKVVDRFGSVWDTASKEIAASTTAERHSKYYPDVAPFRVVHMKEVR